MDNEERCDREESDGWEWVRVEEERRSRAWEPPVAFPWKLEELQERTAGFSWKGLGGGAVDEHSGSCGLVSFFLMSPTNTPFSPLLPPSSQVKCALARAECLLWGTGGRGGCRGKVNELSSFCGRVQQAEWEGGLKQGGRDSLWEVGEEERGGGMFGCSWKILKTSSSPSSPPPSPLLLVSNCCFDNIPPPSSPPPPSLLFIMEVG